ncbi:hypothetical protein Dimus_037597 [Dionaea muscipula]
MAIGQRWGEVLQVEDDTANCTRCDIGKVKISTSISSAINYQMKLIVGWKTFMIRVAEEQSTFISNSNFSCGCLCHRREDEQTASATSDGEGEEGGGDDMDHRLDMSALEAEEDNSQLLIGASRDGIMNNIGGDGNSRSLGEIEMRGCTVPGIVMAAACGGLESTQDEMGGGTGGTRRLGGSVGCYEDC